MVQSKWLKLGAASFLSMGVLAACAEEEPVEEEAAVEEEVVEEEPVEEEVVEEEPVEEEVVEEEPVEEEVVEEETAVDFGNIDEAELETTYLEPLGWTAVEFEEYTLAEYDMAIADFADFAELESTVGPVEDIDPAAIEGAAAEEEAATEEETAVDFGNIDEAELQTAYLEPLGWTAVEFNDYVVAEYDMAIADFADFAELESTVGPVEDIEVAE
ncbi:hypothetical protein [Planococcus lenghuensis]|uniref:hypothetical protein n=1 Tax=Planococcus lenghuensis TaxID=2213202 RepID=UPI0012EB3D06|nr:hypothetical protein [Planococcus lenghuensis]